MIPGKVKSKNASGFNKGNDFNKVYVVEPYYLNNTCSKEEFEEQLQYVKDQI